MSADGQTWNYYGTGKGGGAGGYRYGVQQSQRLARYKEEWAGVSLSRCYDPLTPWSYRCRGQIQFHALVREALQAVHRMKNGDERPGKEFATKPQVSAFYTSYPNPALAAAGHSVLVETKALTAEFAKTITSEVGAMVAELHPACQPAAREAAWRQITNALGNRAILEEAARYEGAHYVEHYRLFQASQCSLRFTYLNDVVEAAVLFGDLLPSVDVLSVHPMTRQLLKLLTRHSQPYFLALPETKLRDFLQLFSAWALDLFDAMAPMLPSKDADRARPPRDTAGADRDADTEYSYGDPGHNHKASASEVPPWEQPQPPILSLQNNAENALQDIMSARTSPGAAAGESDSVADEACNEMREAVNEFQKAVLEASGQTSEWEDVREDILEQKLAAAGFSKGPMEGSPTEGQSVEFTLNGESVGGQLKDRPTDLCEDPAVVGKLQREAAPISDALRRNLYPSEKEQPHIEHIHTSGQLDAKRLPVAGICKAVFRRYRILKEPTPRGKAVLLIAADGSASLSDEQMKMCKLLMTGWLESAHRANVQVLAGLYHSGDAYSCLSSPLVQWIYHPRKTPVMNSAEAVRAVASLPNRGTGCQSDAISLKYMLDEAVAVARGSQIYLTLISDCAWNKCFEESENSAEQEVAGVLELFRKDLGDRLHVTLVALEETEDDAVDRVVDKKITIEDDALDNPGEVAESIGAYVASCIRERRRAARRRN